MTVEVYTLYTLYSVTPPGKTFAKEAAAARMLEPRRCTGRYPAVGGGSLGAAVAVMPLYTRVRTFIDPGGGWCTVSGTANIQQLHTLTAFV